MTFALLNSDDIAAVLVASGFKLESDPQRTKAHAYRHDSMRWPVYVKVEGKAGDLRPSTSSPLVVHHDDARRLLDAASLPAGACLSAAPYKSTGLAAFRLPAQDGTPSGRDLQLDSEAALRAVLLLLCSQQALAPLVGPLAQIDALTAADFAQALVAHADAITAAQRAMLLGHARAPGHQMSMERLALHGGYGRYMAANSQYGRLGRLLASHFGVEGLGNQTQALAIGTEEPDSQGHYVWAMRPPLVEALRALAWLDEDDTTERAAGAIARELDAEDGPRSPTTRQALVNARVGQGLYREQMLDLWRGACAVTGCTLRSALIASHARAWKESSDTERLDPYNGLPLTASIDKLFDQGLISFADGGELLCKPVLSKVDLMHLGLPPNARLRADGLNLRHRPYLAAHRARHGF